MDPSYPTQPAQPEQPVHPQYSPPSVQINQNPMQTPPPHIAPVMHRAKLGDKIEQIIMLCYFFVAALLAFRFGLGLFGARQIPFVEFVHDLSVPFMIPFEGMFGPTLSAGYYTLEFEALVALIVYAGVFFGLAQLVKILFK